MRIEIEIDRTPKPYDVYLVDEAGKFVIQGTMATIGSVGTVGEAISGVTANCNIDPNTTYSYVGAMQAYRVGELTFPQPLLKVDDDLPQPEIMEKPR